MQKKIDKNETPIHDKPSQQTRKREEFLKFIEKSTKKLQLN